MHTTLTIGIPTFNRKEQIIERLTELSNVALHENIFVLIIDNASPDGSYDALTTIRSGLHPDLQQRTTIKMNDGNLGYAGNFFRLITECKTDYILFTSDEDRVIIENTIDLLSLLESESPVFVRGLGSNGRGGTIGRPLTKPMEPSEFFVTTNYISGLCYDVKAAQSRIEEIRTRANSCSAAALYPQILLVASLMVEGCAWWFGKALYERSGRERNLIVDPHEKEEDDFVQFRWKQLPSRWRQFTGTLDYLRFLAKTHIGEQNAKFIESMTASYEKTLYRRLRSAVGIERPELVSCLDSSARARVCNRIRRFFGRIIKSNSR